MKNILIIMILLVAISAQAKSKKSQIIREQIKPNTTLVRTHDFVYVKTSNQEEILKLFKERYKGVYSEYDVLVFYFKTKKYDKIKTILK